MIHINLCVASCDVLTVTINRKQQRALGNNVIIYIVCHSSCDSDSVAYRSHKPRRSPARPLLYAILIYAYPRASKHRDLQTLRFCSLSWEVLDVSLSLLLLLLLLYSTEYIYAEWVCSAAHKYLLICVIDMILALSAMFVIMLY